MGHEARAGAQQTAQVAKDEAAKVASTAKDEVRKLADQSRSELTDQARTQQSRLAGSLHDLGQQFGQMADSADSSGMAGQLARQASDQARSLGSWLDSRDPGEVLDEVKRFARRKPGTFLAVAAGIGFLSGRLTRSLSSDSDSNQSSYPNGAGSLTAGAASRTTATPARSAGTTTYGSAGRRADAPVTTATSTSGLTGEVSETTAPREAPFRGTTTDGTNVAWEDIR